jgi:hypothetical protein
VERWSFLISNFIQSDKQIRISQEEEEIFKRLCILLRLLKSTLISLPVYSLFKNMKNLKQATTLEEQEIIELSLYGDYKLNFSRANLKTGFSKNNKPANRKFQKVRLEGIGEFSC